MFKSLNLVGGILAWLPSASACVDHKCYGPINTVEHVRYVKRMQPGAPGAAYGPSSPLEWGQVNFMHTTDTHGWLAGHLHEQNYGADWGDFKTFTRRMKQSAKDMKVDLLLIDTGDLHDGTGLSDGTTVDGTNSMPIFGEIDYDLMAMGNHELYAADISYQMFNTWAKKWGDKYITSNIKIRNPDTGLFDYVGTTHRYFTTPMGLRVMAFGVIFDFGANSNATQIIKAKDMVQESWFQDLMQTSDPIDMFILLGHNPVRQSDPISTFKPVFDAIRKVYADTPVQIFGGHTHIRDFSVYDANSIALEAGRYCETLGWMSMSGFSSSNSKFRGPKNPAGVPNPTRPAVAGAYSPFVYSRRYLDWNRMTFVYHTNETEKGYDTTAGHNVTTDITAVREEMNLGEVYGCAPQTWCIDCAPITDKGANVIPGVVQPALKTIVVNETRKDTPRMFITDSGSYRFDVFKGPFTRDDNFVLSPFRNVFTYIADVPTSLATNLLSLMNGNAPHKRYATIPAVPRDACTDPLVGLLSTRDLEAPGGVVRRQEALVPGYATEDDWGTDGDDTKHISIPSYDLPKYFETRAAFPDNGDEPATVDVIFFEFYKDKIVTALNDLGGNFTVDVVQPYIGANYTGQDFILPFAKLAWSDKIENCVV